MREPEPKGIDPPPSEQIARYDEYKAKDNKQDDANVQSQYGIGKQLEWQRIVHFKCLTHWTADVVLSHQSVLNEGLASTPLMNSRRIRQCYSLVLVTVPYMTRIACPSNLVTRVIGMETEEMLVFLR